MEPARGPEAERRLEETPDAPDKTTTTVRTGRFSTQAAVEQEGKVLKLITRDMTEKQTLATLKENLAQLKREFQRDLTNARRDGGSFTKLRASYADTATAMFRGFGSDANLNYIDKKLTYIGVPMKEARVEPRLTDLEKSMGLSLLRGGS